MNSYSKKIPVEGVLIALVCVVINIIIYCTGLTQNKIAGYVPLGVVFVGVIWICIMYAKANRDDASFGNVFANGFKNTAAITIIGILYLIIAIKWIMPELVDITVEMARNALHKKQLEETQPRLADAQIEAALTITRKYFLLLAIIGYVFNTVIVGTIASLIGAAVAKEIKKKSNN